MRFWLIAGHTSLLLQETETGGRVMSCFFIWLVSIKLWLWFCECGTNIPCRCWLFWQHKNDMLFFAKHLSFQNPGTTHLISHPSPVIIQFSPPVLSLSASHIAIWIDFSELNWGYTIFDHQFPAGPFFIFLSPPHPSFVSQAFPYWICVTNKVKKHVGDMNSIASTNCCLLERMP